MQNIQFRVVKLMEDREWRVNSRDEGVNRWSGVKSNFSGEWCRGDWGSVKWRSNGRETGCESGGGAASRRI